MGHANFAYVDEYVYMYAHLRNETLYPSCLSDVCELYIHVGGYNTI